MVSPRRRRKMPEFALRAAAARNAAATGGELPARPFPAPAMQRLRAHVFKRIQADFTREARCYAMQRRPMRGRACEAARCKRARRRAAHVRWCAVTSRARRVAIRRVFVLTHVRARVVDGPSSRPLRCRAKRARCAKTAPRAFRLVFRRRANRFTHVRFMSICARRAERAARSARQRGARAAPKIGSVLRARPQKRGARGKRGVPRAPRARCVCAAGVVVCARVRAAQRGRSARVR